MKTIAVIGGGSAGFTAARTACELGANVLFFMGDHADHASLCIESGCMPSKAMFEPIDAMHRAKRHGWLEVHPRDPEKYLAQIVTWKDKMIARFRSARKEQIRQHETQNFRVLRAKARFLDRQTLSASGQQYRFDAVILATGSVNSVPPLGQESIGLEGIWTNDEILRNTRLPASLAVVGAGPVALEFSLRYARLGCTVTIIARSGLLSNFPAQFGQRLTEIYQREGIRILPKHELKSVKRQGDGRYRLELPDAEPVFSKRVLMATGRHPALESLNLAAAGLVPDEKGRLAVGSDMRVTGCADIFAAGDVAGQRMVVHQAHIEAGIAAENAVTGGGRKWARRSNIQVVFSDPEFAFAGQSRQTAEEKGDEVVTASVESRNVSKLLLAGDDKGFGEFVCDKKTRRLIGAGLLCDDASNLIHLPGYAIDHEQTVDQMSDAEYYHPTKMELISELSDALCRKLGVTPLCRAAE